MGRARDTASDVGLALAAELLEAGREVVLRARGASMAPLIRDGDVLTLARCVRAPRPGDLVAANSCGRLLVHRVVRARAGRLLLRGDALWQPDGWFACQYLGHQSIAPAAGGAQIIGRVVAVERGGRPLGAWRAGGPSARGWLWMTPLVRALRGAARRVRARLAPRLA
jgi:hypothetical protein